MKRVLVRPALLTQLLLLFASVSIWAQLYTGSISGAVKDPGGESVPNASITITNVANGFSYKAQTDASGIYTVRNLPPATYTEKVEATGFAPFERPNIIVDVNGNVTVNVELSLSSTQQTVTVAESASPLQTDDATTGQTLNRTAINNLPLVNRNVFDLAFLAPGVTPPAGRAYGTGSQYATNFTSNGSRNDQGDLLLDGVTTTAGENNPGVVKPLYVPPVDAVQEFKVQQSNMTAEIAGGTVINVITRSGTNSLHGELWEFFRNNDLDANNFFSNSAGLGRAHLERNDFGGEVGGPIKKDKAFFFFDFAGLRYLQGVTSGTIGVPSSAERNGNFGELCGRAKGSFNAAGVCSVAAGQIYDPFTGVLNAAGNGATGRVPIPFNNLATYQSPGNPLSPRQLAAVPGNLIDPVSAKLIQAYPLPNVNVGSAAYNPYQNFIGQGANTTNQKSFDLKVDQRFTDFDSLSVRFSHTWQTYQNANFFGNGYDTNTQGPTTDSAYLGVFNYSHTFSPTTVATVSLGYSHDLNVTGGIAALTPGFNQVTTLGLPAYTLSSGVIAPPSINVYGGYASENGNGSIGAQGWSVLNYGSEAAHLIGSVDHIAGSHEIRVGGEVRRYRINFIQAGTPAGIYSFDQFGTATGSSNANGIGGDAMATFLTGYNENGFSQYEIPPSVATQSFDVAGFVQDNWHVNDRLTLNVGVRYDVVTPRTYRYNNANYFDPSAPSPLGPPYQGALQYVAFQGNPRKQFNTYYGAIGPRFGLAYRIGQSTTVRGGYGIFYDPSVMAAAGAGAGGNQGYQAITNGISNVPGFPNVPNSFLSNGFPQGILPVTGNSAGRASEIGLSISGAPLRNWNQIPQEQTWSFGVQKQVPFNILLDAEYVGRKGTHLYFSGTNNLDTVSAQLADAYRANPTYYNQQVPSPFFGNPLVSTTGSLNSRTVPRWQLLLPYPQYTGVTVSNNPAANSIYNALQLRAEKRFSRGLQFLFTYVWSKSIDDSSSGASGLNFLGGGGLGTIQDPNNRRIERSVSAFNLPQVVQFSSTYELPYGRGRLFGANVNSVVNFILGGWQLNGIYRWDDGFPIGLGYNASVNVPTYGGQRPNLTGNLTTCGTGNLNQYFCNPGVAVAPAPYQDGNAPRYLTSARVPGTNNITASLFKSFPLGFREGARIEFRLEAFNVLNHVQFAGPDTTVGNATFGKISAQANAPRQVQLGIKAYF